MCHIVHVGEYARLNECALLAHAESFVRRQNGVHATQKRDLSAYIFHVHFRFLSFCFKNALLETIEKRTEDNGTPKRVEET